MLKPETCRGCPLHNISQSFSVPDGKGTLNIAIIGDKLEHEDGIDGKPFSPRSRGGSLLNQAFQRLGVTRSQFRLGNVVACQPPRNKLEGANFEIPAVQHCRPNFERVLPTRVTEGPDGNPVVILAMGNSPLKALTGASGVHKEKQSVNFLRGFVMRGRDGLVIPTFHPGFIRAGYMKYFGVFVRDLQRAIDVAQGRFYHRYVQNYQQPNYQTSPSLHDAVCFALKVKDNQQLSVGYDIETPHSKDKDAGEKTNVLTLGATENPTNDVEYSYDAASMAIVGDEGNIEDSTPGREEYEDTTILTIQFSTSRTEGICFPWEGRYIEVAKKILSYQNPKMGWNNWGFDDPRLHQHGVQFGGPSGTGTIDLMWKWHHCQPDLDRNLQFAAGYCGWPFPWKHLYGSMMNWYGCADVASLHLIDEVVTAEMKKMGIYQGWERHVQGLHHRVLDPMVMRGYPVDEEERERVGVWLEKKQGELLGAIQGMVPIESGVRKLEPVRSIKSG